MTAKLENINPYSKYGLTRRPTYNEIIGLIGENETLTGTLPDRTATHYKASQEGSFFDGIDTLEILKEQQHRIMERQMREILMRQNLGGGTYSIARLQQQMREANVQSDVEFHSDTNSSAGSRTDASIQAELDEIRRRGVEREQQTGEAHKQGNFLSRNTSSVIEGIARRMYPNIQRRPADEDEGSSPKSDLRRIPKELRKGNKKSKARGSND